MNQPTFDADGYPTAETLQTIADWPATDLRALVDYVRAAWAYPDLDKSQDGEIRLVTGGWSGNESLICALEANHTFYVLCWQSSHRGGLHVFHLPPTPTSETTAAPSCPAA